MVACLSSISRIADWSNVGRILIEVLPNVGRVLVDRWSKLGRTVVEVFGEKIEFPTQNVTKSQIFETTNQVFDEKSKDSDTQSDKH